MTMPDSIVRFDQPLVRGEIDHPRETRREVGNPERETWPLYEAPRQGLSAGIWRCEPGRWRIVFGEAEHEYFFVLEGRVRIHALDGTFTEVKSGQAAIIPPGFEGSFEVLETVRKHFVIVDGMAAPDAP